MGAFNKAAAMKVVKFDSKAEKARVNKDYG